MKPTAFLLFSLVPLLLAAFILWLGAPMVVQCHRVAAPRAGTVPDLEADNAIVPQEGRVDVTMHRRILGVLTVKSDTAIDVVDGHSYVERDRTRRKRGGDTGTVLALELRDGRNWKSPGAYSPIGTPPDEMANAHQGIHQDPVCPTPANVVHVLGVSPPGDAASSHGSLLRIRRIERRAEQSSRRSKRERSIHGTNQKEATSLTE